MSKKTVMPRVGIFWIDATGRMFSESVTLQSAEGYGEFKIFDGSHYALWKKAVEVVPQWKGREYEEIPRGRVVYRKAPKKPEFIVYMPRQIVKFKAKVIVRFNLPVRSVLIDTSDEHYNL